MITILIPTINRPDKLKRALGFLEKESFDGKVIVGDSSEDANFLQTQELCESLELDVRHNHYPQKDFPNDGHVMKAMLTEVDTPFAVYQGDDDLLLPNGLRACCEFLEKNPPLSACHGFRANVTYGKRGIGWSQLVAPAENLQGKPTDRFSYYLRTGLSTQAFVHRTETWKRMYKAVDKVKSRYLGPELLPCSLTYILGGVKHINVLQYVFEKDADNRQVDWAKKSFFDYMNAKEWAPSVAAVRKDIIAGMGEMGIDEAEAGEVFDREFWLHCGAVTMGQWKDRFEPSGAKPANHLHEVLNNPNWEHYTEWRKVSLWGMA